MTVGQRIFKIIEDKRISKTEFAKTVGTTPSYLYRVKDGKRSPSKKLLHRICDAYNINFEWLNDGTGEVERDTTESVMKAVSLEFNDMDEVDKILLQTYLDLPPIERHIIKQFLMKFSENLNEDIE